MDGARFQSPLLNSKPRLLVIGGQPPVLSPSKSAARAFEPRFAGTFCCRELRSSFEITLVDAKARLSYLET